jgi:hypothetical protein
MSQNIDCKILWLDSNHDYGGIPAQRADIDASCYSSQIYVNGHGYNNFTVQTATPESIAMMAASSCRGNPNNTFFLKDAVFMISSANQDQSWLSNAASIIRSVFGASTCQG